MQRTAFTEIATLIPRLCLQFDYMAFLALFCYVILVRQDKIPSTSEIVLIIFVSTLCTEEIRQVIQDNFTQSSQTLHQAFTFVLWLIDSLLGC